MHIRSLLEEKERAALSLACLVMAGIWAWALWPRPPALSVTFLNVGQGDAAVVRTPSGRTAVIDCGPGPTQAGGFDAGARVVVPFLRREGVNRIDALILTHPHEDHVGGAMSVVRNFQIDSVLDSGIAHPTGCYGELLGQIEARAIPYRRVRRGQAIDFHDGVRMEVLNPPPGAAAADGESALNNSSVVLRITYGDVSFLMAGDAEKQAELDMLSACRELSAQVLKVGHHGSSKATSLEWLAAVRPQFAVISVGWRNPFGHPGSDTLKRLEEAGAEVYRTDRNGGITITTDGRRIAVRTSRN